MYCIYIPHILYFWHSIHFILIDSQRKSKCDSVLKKLLDYDENETTPVKLTIEQCLQLVIDFPFQLTVEMKQHSAKKIKGGHSTRVQKSHGKDNIASKKASFKATKSPKSQRSSKSHKGSKSGNSTNNPKKKDVRIAMK